MPCEISFTRHFKSVGHGAPRQHAKPSKSVNFTTEPTSARETMNDTAIPKSQIPKSNAKVDKVSDSEKVQETEQKRIKSAKFTFHSASTFLFVLFYSPS